MRIVILLLVVAAFLSVPAVPVCVQAAESATRWCQKQDYNLGEFRAASRPDLFARDGRSCLCFYSHYVHGSNIYKVSKQPAELNITNCVAFCAANVNDAKGRGPGDTIIEYCHQPGNWK